MQLQNKNRPSALTPERHAPELTEAFSKHILSFRRTARKRNLCSALAVIFVPKIRERNDIMAKRKKKNTLPNGSKRLQVYVGMVDVLDENGNPVLDENIKVKKKRKYESVTAASLEDAK